MQNEKIEQYIRQVLAEIHNLSSSDAFIEALRQQLYDYAEEYPDFSLEELENNFGTPEDVANDFLESVQKVTPVHAAKSKKKYKIIIIVMAALILSGALYLYDLSQQTQTMATDVITIYESPEENE